MPVSTSSDPRSPLVFDTRVLRRRVGAMTEVTREAPAPADFGTAVISVPAQSPISLQLRLEEVGEGVLVTGSARAVARGECGRCLAEIVDDVEVDIQELFVRPQLNHRDSDAGTSQLIDELVDLEPVLRDQLVLDLPFQPVCGPDCLGLCPSCGLDLNSDPDHRHTDSFDPRWNGLAGLASQASHRNSRPTGQS